MGIWMKDTRLVRLREDLIPLLILFLLPLVYLGGALFHPYNILGSPSTDIQGEAHSKMYGYGELLNLSMPLWSPYRFGGMPYAAAPGVAFFYPFNLICVVLPINYAINWDIAFHLFLSGIFTYYLLRNFGVNRSGATIGGTVYMLSAPMVMHIYAGHLIAITSMPWTPLMFLFLDRFILKNNYKYGISLSLTIALQLLAGYPQYLFYSLIALAFYLLFLLTQLKMRGAEWSRICKNGLGFAVFVILGFAVSAVQIIPAMEIAGYSTRENLSYKWVSTFSFPPENLITLLVPDFFGDMLKVLYWGKNYLWEMSAYVGIVPLILAIIAIFYTGRGIALFFAGLAVLSVILAFGKYTPLLKLLYTYVPGFNLFRGNSKFIFLNALSLAMLSGFGADTLGNSINNQNRRFRWAIIGLGIFLGSVMLLMSVVLDEAWFKYAITKVIFSGDLYSDGEPFTRPGFAAFAFSFFRRGALWMVGLLTAGTAILLLYSFGKIKEKTVIAAISFIIVFDLFTFGMRYMETFDIRNTYLDRDVINFLKQDREPFRMIAPGLPLNIGISSRIETLSGYDNLMIKRYSEFINLSQGISPDVPNLALSINSVNKLTDLLNARYVVLRSNSTIDDPAFEPVFNNGRYRIYKNRNALPRAFVVHGVKIIKDRDSILRELSSSDFDPARYAVVEEELDTPLNNQATISPVPRFIEHSPNKVVVETSLTEPGLLVLGDTYYPGWKAYVDGKETKMYPANYVMRGVFAPEGRHIVEFRYDPLSFKIGAVITVVTLVFISFLFVLDLRQSRSGVS